MKQYFGLQTRTWLDKNGIEHHATDYYSNAKEPWRACCKAVGSRYKDEVECWLGTENLICEEAGEVANWYVCWRD